MKYMITWNERPQGSATAYENAQKRILEVGLPHIAIPGSKLEPGPVVGQRLVWPKRSVGQTGGRRQDRFWSRRAITD